MDPDTLDIHLLDDRVGQQSPSPVSPPVPPTGAPGRRRGPTAGQWRNRITGHAEVAPASLLPNPDNWRRHPPRQQRALAGALGEVGWVAQVLVNRTSGHLVDGHLRLELALARGEPTVPVAYVELSEAEERLVLASLDPLGAMADTDRDALRLLLAEVTPSDQALTRMLAELADRNGIIPSGLGDPEAVPEVPAEADLYVRAGDLWQLGEQRLLCGDARDPGDVARLLAGEQPTLLVTDPPYGVSLDMEWRDRAGINRLGPAEPSYLRGEGHRATRISGDTIADWSAAYALVPSLEVAYVWHSTSHLMEVGAGLESIGFELRQQIVWAKTVPVISRSAYNWQHEPCWYAVRKGCTAHWQGDGSQTTIWLLASPKMTHGGSREAKFDHPTQKPIEAMARPLRNHAGEVYDPFVGSGTTLIAAELLGRRGYAMELEPRHVQVTIERWQTFTGRRAVRISG
jgi:DNA modification methylase